MLAKHQLIFGTWGSSMFLRPQKKFVSFLSLPVSQFPRVTPFFLSSVPSLHRFVTVGCVFPRSEHGSQGPKTKKKVTSSHQFCLNSRTRNWGNFFCGLELVSILHLYLDLDSLVCHPMSCNILIAAFTYECTFWISLTFILLLLFLGYSKQGVWKVLALSKNSCAKFPYFTTTCGYVYILMWHLCVKIAVLLLHIVFQVSWLVLLP